MRDICAEKKNDQKNPSLFHVFSFFKPNVFPFILWLKGLKFLELWSPFIPKKQNLRHELSD